MKELAQKITADKELTKKAFQQIKSELDRETAKPAGRRNFGKIAALSDEICELADKAADVSEISDGIDKLYNRIYEYEKERKKPSGIIRRIIPVVCVAAVMIAANCFTVAAFGRNVFTVMIDFTMDGFSVDFAKKYEVIELPSTEDDPYGIIAECAKYDVYPETPFYLPEGYKLNLMTNHDDEFSSGAKFVFRKGRKSIAMDFTRYWDYVPKIGIPSDEYNITETTVNGHTAIISKEDNQFTLLYQIDKTVIMIFTQDVEYAECDKIVASMR